MNCDPSGEEGSGLNLYRYASNNPVMRVDPTGMKDETIEQSRDHWTPEPDGESMSSQVATEEYEKKNSTQIDSKSKSRKTIILVGEDSSHNTPDTFIKRVDRLLNKDTVEDLKLKPEDSATIIVPKSMDKNLVKTLEGYGKGKNNYKVMQKTSDELVSYINSTEGINALLYFGHGIEDALLYDDGLDLSQINKDSFAPDSKVTLITCNSKWMAEKFTKRTGVTSEGVEGTTFFGTNEVSGGVYEGGTPGNVKSYVFKKDESGKVKSSSHSISQKYGTPFLKLKEGK